MMLVEPSGLSAALSALDRILALAVEHQAQRLGTGSLLDPWRGMHLGLEDVRRILTETSLVALREDRGMASLLGGLARQAPQIARMADWLGLSNEDLTIVLLALAPEVDLRYERLFGYLQDDITRRRPGFDLVANLFCVDMDERLMWLGRFGQAAPLILHGILDVDAMHGSPLALKTLVLDAQWRNFLLGLEETDPRLVAFARLLPAASRGIDHVAVDGGVRLLLKRAVGAAATGGGDVRMVFVGPHGAGKRAIAAALAHELSLRLLAIDVRAFASAAELAEGLARAHRASRPLRALLYIHGASELASLEPQKARALTETLANSGMWFVLSLTAPLPQMHVSALSALRISLTFPSLPERLAAWLDALRRNQVPAQPGDVQFVSAQFRLSAAQIEQAVVDVRVRLAAEERTQCCLEDLSAAARASCGDELVQLSQRISPKTGFAGLVTSAEVTAQLREICDRIATRDRVRHQWPVDSVHVRDAGLSVLFAGPSGTGKTLAAEALAHELGLDLFRIDLSAVVSKYIGETEKNLNRLFAAAEYANAVLFFDEADALFGKRSEVKNAHDRYANLEVAYLLQKMEQFEGVAILATNLRQNLDGAFARRLAFCVNFAFPEESERARLWEALWPVHATQAEDVDLAWFAREFALSGGNIRNAIVAAAHLAAAEDTTITHDHLLHATRREYQKLGKNLSVSVQPVRGAVA
jgi:AAA+ superfamily predicted ATPase